MLRKNTHLIILLLLISVMSIAEEGFYIQAKHVLVTDVNMQAKTITFQEKNNDITKKFNMELLQDVYYKSTTEKYNLNKIPLNKKYYVMIRYVNEKDFKSKNQNMLGEIYYIGTVDYPF